MSTITSKDGTQIAYEQHGAGPAVILVDGALCYRGFGPMPKLSELLAPHFTVYTYDRRGRGESGPANSADPLPREIEDLQALIDETGGPAYVYGISSGACLALEAATRPGARVKKLALYEPPYNSDPDAVRRWRAYRKSLAEVLAAGKNGDAVELFMRLVGTPAEMVSGMRQAPVWPMLEAVAPTLPYDAAAIGEDGSVPVERAAGVVVPTLVMSGTALPFMLETAAALAKAIPNARQQTLEGQTHDVNPEVLAPVLIEFFKE